MRETWQRRACAEDVYPPLDWAARQRARHLHRLRIVAWAVVVSAIVACGLIWAAVTSSI